jgi:hypothetical protein
MNILPIDPDHIPEKIKNCKRLVCWNLDKRDGKSTKVPINPYTNKLASVSDPSTWGDWITCWNSYESGKNDGIGIVFNGDGLIGIDFDNCRDFTTGNIDPNILKEVKYLNSYTEISPSGTGLHTYILGKLPKGARRKDKIEIYDSGRYFTLTGKHLKETPKEINANQASIDTFYKRMFNDSTQQALEKAFASQNGQAIKSLYEGTHSYSSQSEADLALCGHLAYWTNSDTQEMDRLFRASGLMRPKWDEKRPEGTYGSLTIQKVLSQSFSVPTKQKSTERRRKILQINTIGTLMKKYDTKTVWLWRNIIAPREPQMVNGREGDGKTTFCLKMSQEILDENPANYILWLATEGATRNTVIKANDMGLTTERFIIPNKEDGSFLFNFKNQADIDLVDATLESLNGNVIAVFIDSLRGCSTLDENESKLGKLMIQLNSIVCDKHGAALIYIHHLNKSDRSNLLDRSAGNTAITGAVRHVLTVDPASKSPSSTKICVAKTNFDAPFPTLTVFKTDKDIIIRELKQAVVETQKDKSEELLVSLFTNRKEIPASEIESLGEQKGISKDVLNKAKKQLGIESTKVEGGWRWVWPYK